MKPEYDFDTSPYFKAAALDLLSVHGEDALFLADRAIDKMKSLEHEEGLLMWQGIQTALLEEFDSAGHPSSPTRH